MRDIPFKLDTLLDLPRYVGRDTYQTIVDDKSGYDFLLLSLESRTFFGMQWGGGVLCLQHPAFWLEDISFRIPLHWFSGIYFLPINKDTLFVVHR